MKNHDIRITYAPKTLSFVLCTQRGVMEDLCFDLEHLITMNSVLFYMFLIFAKSFINPKGSSPRAFTNSHSGSFCKVSHRPRLIEFSFSDIILIHCAQKWIPIAPLKPLKTSRRVHVVA
jgi:hypothetical protein